MKRFSIILLFLIFFVLPQKILAANSLDIIISEICWMGTDVSANDEWLELYNNTDGDINLEGWGIYEAGGETLIEPLTGTIFAHSYYLIERTDDTTLPSIPASQEPSGWSGHGLKNSGEHLQLLDNNSNTIDEVNCSDNWFQGDKSTKQTMERISSSVSGNSSSNWQTSQDSNGTPKRANGPGFQPPPPPPPTPPPSDPKPKPEPKPTPPPPKPEPDPEPAPELPKEEPSLPIKTPEEAPSQPAQPIEYPEGIIINEILPSPEGPDSENEWIELYNQNDFEVNISNWKIQDEEGRTTTYTFPKDTKILAKKYLILTRPLTKITLNNDGEELTLIQPNDKTIDSVVCPKASQGQSYNRTTSGNWSWSSTLTPNKPNIVFQKVSSVSTSKKTATEEITQENILEKGTAIIGEKSIPKTKGQTTTFLIAINMALFSGITILILKRKLDQTIDINDR